MAESTAVPEVPLGSVSFRHLTQWRANRVSNPQLTLTTALVSLPATHCAGDYESAWHGVPRIMG